MPAITGKEPVVEAPTGSRERFISMLYGEGHTSGVLRAEWRAPDDAVKYLEGRGWWCRYDHPLPNRRVEVREVRRPLYPGARTLDFGIFITITHPDGGPFLFALDRKSLMGELADILTEPLLRVHEGPEYARPVYNNNSMGESTISFPNGLAVCAEKKRLLISFHEDPSYELPTVVAKLPAPGKPVVWKPATDGALHYPFTREMANPWLVFAGQGWPALKAKGHAVPSPEGAKARFAALVTPIVQPAWLPAKLDAVPYRDGLGYLVVTETPQYRVRIRAVAQEVIGNANPDRALVLAVEKKDGAFPALSLKEHEALLATFLQPALLHAPAHDAYPPCFTTLDGGTHYARYHRDGAPVPAYNIFSWQHGNLLLIAVCDDRPDDCDVCAPTR